MDELRLAVVGCGGISGTHLRGLEAADERVRVTALVDIDLARAEKAATNFEGAVAATTVAEVMDQADAFLLSIPHDLHHSIGMTCLRAGKHVLMEKPLANTEAECLELIETAEAAGLTLMVGYILRYNDLVIKMHDLIQDGTIGEVFHVGLWTEQLTMADTRPWLGDHKRLGGGQLFSHGCHYIDLLLWMLGEPEYGSHIGTNRGTPWMDWEGTSDVSIHFAGGKIGYHMGTWGARGSVLRNSMHAHGTLGMLELNRTAGELRLHTGLMPHVPGQAETAREPIKLIATEQPGKNSEGQIRHFVDCVQTGTTPRSSARDSLQSLRVIWRLYDAERERRFADLSGLGLIDHP